MDFAIAKAKLTLLGIMSVTLGLSGCLMNDPVEYVDGDTGTDTPNAAPTINGNPPPMVKVGVNYAFMPNANDPDLDTLSFRVVNKPNWADFNTTSGELTGVPFLGSEGTYNDIMIEVSDGNMTSSLPEFSITVEPESAANMPPQISGTPTGAVLVGETFSFTPTAMDPDGDSLTFSVMNMPSWLSFNTSTGALLGTPQAGDAGTYNNISITVSDSQLGSSTPAFSIEVTQAALGSVTLSWSPPTQNTDGTTLMDLAGYRIYYGTAQGNYPNSIVLDNQPGISTYVVENLTPGTYYFVSTAVNDQGMESNYSNVAQKMVN